MSPLRERALRAVVTIACVAALHSAAAAEEPAKKSSYSPVVIGESFRRRWRA